jgi:hypothetical protein
LGVTGNLTQKVDEVLNYLEALATSEPSERRFFQLLLQQLRTVLNCNMVARVQPVSDTEWLVVQSASNLVNVAHPDSMNKGFQEHLARNTKSEAGADLSSTWRIDQQQFWAVPIQSDSWVAGGLVAQFQSIGTLQSAAVLPILQAFSEISHAYLQRWHAKKGFYYSSEIQKVVRNVAASDSYERLSFCLANDLRVFLRADRISVWRQVSPSRLNMVAMSDCAALPEESRFSEKFRTVAEDAWRTRTIVSATEATQDDVSRRWLAFGWPTDAGKKSHDLVLVGFWEDEERYLEALSRLRSAFTSLDIIASQVSGQLAVPKWIRELYRRKANSRMGLRLVSLFAITALLVLLAIRPIPFHIEGKAYLEPEVKANVFATYDGIVEEIRVTDGDKVDLGQQVLKLRSADIEMEIEKIEGELLALHEKRNGFQVSLNQLPSTDPQGVLARSQLSAEVMELEQREKQLDQLLLLHTKKQQELSIRSPVNGVIVTEKVHEKLEQRPVKRGERLLEVADTLGNWLLKVEVPDREAGHIKKAYAQNQDLRVRFRIVSDPDQEYLGKIARISDSIKLNRNNESVWIIDVHFEQSKVPLMFGASVAAQFECGSQPTWYVWVRPIWEGLRRRFWL